jgi:hypothetical protein
MTDHSSMPRSGSNPDVPASTAAVERHDLSIRNTPQEWYTAEEQSPQDRTLAGTRHQLSPTFIPMRRRLDGSTVFLSGAVALILTSVAWIATEVLGLFGSPWLAVPAGVLIALVIRAGCGQDDAEGRGTASAIVYLVTFLVVMAFLTRSEIHQIYGDTGVGLLEQNLFRRRFSRIDQLAAYAIGWATSWYTSLWLRY